MWLCGLEDQRTPRTRSPAQTLTEKWGLEKRVDHCLRQLMYDLNPVGGIVPIGAPGIDNEGVGTGPLGENSSVVKLPVKHSVLMEYGYAGRHCSRDGLVVVGVGHVG